MNGMRDRHPVPGGACALISHPIGREHRLNKCLPVEPNPGKKSSKFIQDCTICRSCR